MITIPFQNERCVCFDEYGIVMQPSENSSLCRMCEGRSDCNSFAVTYKGNLQRAVVSRDLPFFDHLKACEENHFSYPLQMSENSVQLCDISESDGTDNWVGVYRQTLSTDYFDKTDDSMNDQEHLYNSSQSIPMCHNEGPDKSDANNQSSGNIELRMT
ncbi:Hypothetical predicted protein [Mytilus galloprovincialis]|uniref:Uncharacterized protein n=1 Tax=Mytilus galloprovincialis TaxID=29158 RepID=A0A8B6FE51_MYTGA|nr:Hypothetical predicted protein [Mytilus galloprovincialis]